MKTTWVITVLLLSACGHRGDRPAEAAAGSGSEIVNGGFEAAGASPAPAGWHSDAPADDAQASFTAKPGYQGGYALYQKAANAYRVHSAQQLTGLADGYYTLRAYVRNSGGQQACYLYATSGSMMRMTSLPVSPDTWVPVQVPGIEVTDGRCDIGLYSDAAGGQWCAMDEVSLGAATGPFVLLKGGDISELSYVESRGGRFLDSGASQDCIRLLKAKGFNIVRLRLYNDPGNPGYSPSNRLPRGFQDTADILHLARRAAAAGLQILLTFHYSDYWTNPGVQTKPHAWAALHGDSLAEALYQFTYRFMSRMRNQGTLPQYVALGNETPGGLLFPDGDINHAREMAALFRKGYEAVKAVSPASRVIIHLDAAGDTAKYDWFFSTLLSEGAHFDIIGASYYPFWTGLKVADIRNWATYISQKFSRPVLLMETGYNWSPVLADGSTGQLSDNGPYQYIYPATPAGQKDFLYELFNGIKLAGAGTLLGDIYWDPVMIPAPGVGWELGANNVVANSTLFDFNGNALSSFKAYQYNN